MKFKYNIANYAFVVRGCNYSYFEYEWKIAGVCTKIEDIEYILRRFYKGWGTEIIPKLDEEYHYVRDENGRQITVELEWWPEHFSADDIEITFSQIDHFERLGIGNIPVDGIRYEKSIPERVNAIKNMIVSEIQNRKWEITFDEYEKIYRNRHFKN